MLRCIWLVLLLALEAAQADAAPLCPEKAWNGAIGLPYGRALVVGHRGGCLYDRQARAWTPTGPLETPRRMGRLVVLADGRVLLVGGHTDVGPAWTAESLDPAAGAWTESGPLNSPYAYERGHAVVALADGRAVVIGNHALEVYDPLFAVWLRGPDPGAYGGHSLLLLDDGRLQIFGGHIVPLVTGYYDGPPTTVTSLSRTIEILTPPRRDEDLAPADSSPGQPGVTRLLWHAMMDGGSVSTRLQLGPRMHTRRSFQGATRLPDGSVLITGGATDNAEEQATGPAAKWHENIRSRVIPSVERWLPATGRFEQLAPMSMPRCFHASVLLGDGRLLVLGGWRAPSYTQTTTSVEAYSPKTNRWRKLRPLARSAADTQAVLLRDGAILVASFGELPEIYRPPPP